jgi:hypothetical protein
MSPLNKERLAKLRYLQKTDPRAFAEIIELIFEVERRDERRRYEASFLAFVKTRLARIRSSAVKTCVVS